MSAGTIALGISLGLAAGVLSGLFGVGGGILFVPVLVAIGLGQVEASATSLLAIVPTAGAGIWRQARVEAGVRIATSLPESTLRKLFGVLLLGVAAQLSLRTARSRARIGVEP